MLPLLRGGLIAATLCVAVASPAASPEAVFPPILPGGEPASTDTSPEFLTPPATLRPGVLVAKTAPTVDFQFFPGQAYPGKPWSAWGDSLAAGGKYYASLGDHLAPAGNAFVYEYDPATREMHLLADVAQTLHLPAGHYAPGKIHSRLDLGSDGWLYFSTHRGSTRVTTDEYHYEGDWILRCRPDAAGAEIVAHGPVPKHCLPCSVLDPDRLIYYGGTAPGTGRDGEGVQFYAYDVKARKVLYSGPDGPPRAIMLARSTGRVYFTPGKEGDGALRRWDPATGGAPEPLAGIIGVRAATEETRDGHIYTVSNGQGGGEATLYAFDTRTEKIEALGPAGVGSQNYITSLDVDATGRYLYYIPGAHGGSDRDAGAVVQYDLQTRQRKVIAFLQPYYTAKFGCTLKGTYSSALDPAGDKLYITWNNHRGGRAWDSVVLTVVHLPASERPAR